MKKLFMTTKNITTVFLLTILLTSLGYFVFTELKSIPPPQVLSKTKNDKTIVYYFHGNMRCVSCRKIEAYTKEAIEKNFSGQLKNGTMELLAVNTEEKANEHFIKDYDITTRSVILSETKGGKELKWKNLDKVWELLKDKEAFINYIAAETEKFMQGNK